MILKAGTYKFKNTLGAYEGASEITMEFQSKFAINVVTDVVRGVFNCSSISFAHLAENHISVSYYVNNTEPDISGILATTGTILPTYFTVYDGTSWFTDTYGEEIKAFVLKDDADVTDAFYYWFINNVEPVPYTIEAKVSALINRANIQTGKVATDLSTAVGQLIDEHCGNLPSAEGVKF